MVDFMKLFQQLQPMLVDWMRQVFLEVQDDFAHETFYTFGITASGQGMILPFANTEENLLRTAEKRLREQIWGYESLEQAQTACRWHYAADSLLAFPIFPPPELEARLGEYTMYRNIDARPSRDAIPGAEMTDQWINRVANLDRWAEAILARLDTEEIFNRNQDRKNITLIFFHYPEDIHSGASDDFNSLEICRRFREEWEAGEAAAMRAYGFLRDKPDEAET